MSKKRILSGIQPSGNLHLGNYIGALSQWVEHQDEFDSYFCIVDLHAITVPQDPKTLQANIRSLAAWYLAAGIDPDKSTIFVQSQNADHAQLGWILNCYTGIGQLDRMTQYKDKSGREEFVSVGLFDYPVLMAADILLYDADAVPVGEDQKQHIELTRDLAERFNHKYGETFKMPEYLPPMYGERIMSLSNPENKMSKSAKDPKGTINLSDEPDVIRQKIISAATDSGNEIKISTEKPAISNLINIFIALTGKTEEELDQEFSGKGYKLFKEALADVVVEKLTPLQQKHRTILNSSELDQVLTEGLKRAQKISSPKLQAVQKLIGLG